MNPADQRFTDRLYRDIAALKRELQDIKTAQRMGLDNFVDKFSDVASSSVFLGSGEEHSFRINYLSDTPRL